MLVAENPSKWSLDRGRRRCAGWRAAYPDLQECGGAGVRVILYDLGPYGLFCLRRRGRDWSRGAGLRLLAAMELTTAAGSAATLIAAVPLGEDGAVRGDRRRSLVPGQR
jgi:hypothetical protein